MKINKAITGIDKSGSFRVYMAITTKMAEDARLVHQASPLATHLLGRALTGTGLVGLMLREPGFKVTFQFKGNGPAQQVLCTAYSDGAVKGYIANPDVSLPARADGSPDAGGALGAGTLTCIRDAGMKEPYMGSTDLVSGEIADDMAAYFFLSEQQKTSVSLGVKITETAEVEAAGGIIIQMLPDASEEAACALEEWLPKMPKISELVTQAQSEEDSQLAPEEVAQRMMEIAFSGIDENFSVKPLETLDIGWKCDCSEERLEQIVMSLGSREIRDIIDEDGQAELTCQFCRKKYNFERAHLERLLYESINRKMH